MDTKPIRRTQAAAFIFALFLTSFLQGTADITYGTGSWDADKYGNHRAVLHVDAEAEAVAAHIEWRRRDKNPELKNIIIVDGTTGERISNIIRAEINREYGDIVFQPSTAPGDYYVYYMPYVQEGRNYPKVTYPEPDITVNPDWLKANRLDDAAALSERFKTLPEAGLKEIQSIDEFNSFYPMEVIATKAEVDELLGRYPGVGFLIFPEDRIHPIRMTEDLPQRWIQRGLTDTIEGDASRGEYFPFQIGVYARMDIRDIEIEFSNLRCDAEGAAIPSTALNCINKEGINWDGRPILKTIAVKKNKVQPLWCGISIPRNVPPGLYAGTVKVIPEGLEPSEIIIKLHISEAVLDDHGDSQLWRLSRLRWLDSRLAQDKEVTKPFTPISVNGDRISILGRTLTISENGLPDRIQSFFNSEVTGTEDTALDVITAPFSFVIETEDGETLTWQPSEKRITDVKTGEVGWEAESSADSLRMTVEALMEYDGFAHFQIRLTADSALNVKDIRLEVPYAKSAARYMLGLGQKGGIRPERLDWKWDRTKNQDAVWMGAVNAGLYCGFRAENYSRPLNTNFYLSKPLNMPPSWWNGGRGGITITEDADTVLLKAFTGERTLNPDQDLHFDFILLMTPFKPIDLQSHWAHRYYHAFKPIEEIKATGANTINTHHGNDANPYINYPFIHTAQMKAYIDEAHAEDMKVKIYNTIRELSNRAPEIWALRSLGHEIFSSGPGGGFSWLQEHLGEDYIAAWFVPDYKDAAIINSGMSRWHNYYIEGLDWLARNIGIDGLYIDDVAFDRTTMKRVRKVLDRNRRGALIDLHSANQFNERDGYINSALLYMEHFPYLNRLWFGEYFDYNQKPDFWLAEVSGIPFGLMGEMLQDGGNPYRGMIFGMTSRLPWAGDPRPIWKVWDDFGIEDARMYGFWSSKRPLRTDSADVYATAYVKDGQVLIAVASWSDKTENIRLTFDWEALGIDRRSARLTAPAVENFQNAAGFSPTDRIPVEPGKGWLLILK